MPGKQTCGICPARLQGAREFLRQLNFAFGYKTGQAMKNYICIALSPLIRGKGERFISRCADRQFLKYLTGQSQKYANGPKSSLLKHFKIDLGWIVRNKVLIRDQELTRSVYAAALQLWPCRNFSIYFGDTTRTSPIVVLTLQMSCPFNSPCQRAHDPELQDVSKPTYLEFGEAFGDQISGAMQLFYWRHLFVVVERECRKFPAPQQVIVGS